MVALPVLVLAGCSLRGDVEMLESELRRQEQVQDQLTAELRTTRDDLKIAQSDSDGLRARLSQRGKVSLASEQAEVLYRADGIKFNMLLTSGANRDSRPGDDGVSVLILPVDAQGDLVKLVGAIEIELLELARDDEKQIGRWQFTVDEVREHWHRGFLSAGYLFQLDWQSIPKTSELTLHAKLTAPDGRKFDATTQLKVNLDRESPAAIAESPPALQQPPAVVEPAGHSVPAARRPAARSKPRAAKASPPSLRKPPERTNPVGHTPLETSDKWTDETIPRMR